jgi:LPXTG-motif cell wall-anchored protein
MSPRIRTLLGMGLLAAAVGVATAQVSQKTTETKGAPMKTSKARVVEGEVVSVSGNDVVFKTATGAREVKVPDGFKFDMEGKEIGVADLKPGMKVKATVTETTTVTPVTVTDVRQAEVLDTTGGNLIVRGPKGIRKWSAKDIAENNIKIYREGKEAQIGDFRKGDRITAVIISQKPPETVSERSVKASATGAPEAPAPAPAPAAAAAPAPAPAPAAEPVAAAAPAKKKLPKTASPVPMVGLLGVLSLASGLALTIRRRRSR